MHMLTVMGFRNNIKPYTVALDEEFVANEFNVRYKFSHYDLLVYQILYHFCSAGEVKYCNRGAKISLSKTAAWELWSMNVLLSTWLRFQVQNWLHSTINHLIVVIFALSLNVPCWRRVVEKLAKWMQYHLFSVWFLLDCVAIFQYNADAVSQSASNTWSINDSVKLRTV